MDNLKEKEKENKSLFKKRKKQRATQQLGTLKLLRPPRVQVEKACHILCFFFFLGGYCLFLVCREEKERNKATMKTASMSSQEPPRQFIPGIEVCRRVTFSGSLPNRNSEVLFVLEALMRWKGKKKD